MKREEFTIDYPTDSNIRIQINTILDQSLPTRKTFFGFLREMHSQLGWRYIFRNYLDLGIISALFLFYVGVFIFITDNHFFEPLPETHAGLYAYLFVTAPLLYGSFSVISILDKQKTFDVEMVCKYNVYQVAAYRMLVFGFVSIVANMIQILIVSSFLHHFNPVLGIMVSLTSLLIFAIAFLYITNRSVSKIRQALVITLWVLLNLCMTIWNRAIYEQILVRIPFAIYALVILMSGILYLKSTKQLTAIQRRDFHVRSM